MISQFKRYSPFSCQTISCEFDSTPEFGKTFDLTVPRHGDLIKNMCLRFGISPPSEIINNRQGFVPSVHMFEKFELLVGDTIIETLYPEFINIYYNTFIDFSKKKGNTYNLGPLFNNRDVDAELPDSDDSINSDTTRTYNMMLPFYFSMKSSQSFPLCALFRQELVLRVYMRNLTDIIKPETPVSSYPGTLDRVRLTHMFVDTEYVFLGDQEFKYFVNNPQFYMYTETQQQVHRLVEIQTDEDENQIVTRNTTLRLEFINPVVELFMYVLRNSNLSSNRVDKEELYNDNKHTITSVNLEIDGHTYIDENIADSVFLSQLQYMLNHSSAFENSTTTKNMYVYNYSFSDDPESCCPSGTVNFSVIKHNQLRVNLPTVSIETEKTLFVLARSINILKIQDGTAEILFKNMA